MLGTNYLHDSGSTMHDAGRATPKASMSRYAARQLRATSWDEVVDVTRTDPASTTTERKLLRDVLNRRGGRSRTSR